MKKIYFVFVLTLIFCIMIYGQGTWTTYGTDVNGKVLAIAVADNGDVYIGGDFTSAGGVSGTNHIARWDGTSWHELSGGVNGSVEAIAIHGKSVYIAGAFTQTGVPPVSGTVSVAKWNGTGWEAMGEGANNHVWSIGLADKYIYAGGNFTEVYNTGSITLPAFDLARWDTTTNTWEACWGTTNTDTLLNIGYILEGSNNDIYIGEWLGLRKSTNGINFTLCGNMGSPYTNFIETIAIDHNNGNVYVGGPFLKQFPFNSFTDRIAMWDTANKSWNALGNGLTGPFGAPEVRALTVIDTLLFAGGKITDYLQLWNITNNSWTTINGVNEVVEVLTLHGNDIYVGGAFTTVGGTISNYFAMYSPLITSVKKNDDSHVFDVYASGKDVFVNYNNWDDNNAILNFYNLQGQKVLQTQQIAHGSHCFKIDQPSGCYIIKVLYNQQVYIKKIYIH